MTSAVLQEAALEPRLLHRYTVQDYHRAIRAGVLEEDTSYELLDGHVVRKLRNASGEDLLTISGRHSKALGKINRLASRIEKAGGYLRIQQPVTLPPHNEPEPDAAIARGSVEDYDQHPTPEDLLCVIEAADASLRRDRDTKQRVYAAAGIPLYVIINLVDDVVEVYRDPRPTAGRYDDVTTLTKRDTLTLPLPSRKSLKVPVKQLLP